MKRIKRVLERFKPIANRLSPPHLISALRRRRIECIRKFHYRPEDTTCLANAVLFAVFTGKDFGDSPKEIFLALKAQRPDLKLYWTTWSNSEPPEGAVGVKFGSRKWLKALATSSYLVNNSSFPWYFRKAQGQIYLQTWHGTPLKRLGREIVNYRLSNRYLQTMDREATYWDYLISPNAYCSEIFPGAFNYKGPLIETGYPRNDRLVIQPEGLREKVRSQLGVSSETRLILYAPTWRDFNRSPKGRYATVNFFGADLELPEGFRLAYRGHSNTHVAHQSDTAGGAIDVTLYPDVTELYIAADILITDYSSVMFDFTNTGKPMIFLAPDLKFYEEDRGFYFDYRATVPGPIFNKPEDVVEALGRIDEIAKQYESKYKSWQKRYNSLDDGHATQRVVNHVFK
jgi:CDP-glycerol glycerophosphotransferase